MAVELELTMDTHMLPVISFKLYRNKHVQRVKNVYMECDKPAEMKKIGVAHGTRKKD